MTIYVVSVPLVGSDGWLVLARCLTVDSVAAIVRALCAAERGRVVEIRIALVEE